MINLLTNLNFSMPNLVEEKLNKLVVKKINKNYEMFIDNKKWNNYDSHLHTEAFQVFSHYYLAEGHCICTGLGFLIRENWILNKSNVSKVTILENNLDIINYHNKFNKNIMEKIEIIYCNANEFEGKCDTLLLDHYEQETDQIFIESLQKIQKNIKCNKMWAWSVEPIIDSFSNSYFNNYNYFRKKYNLFNLPNLNENELNMFVSIFFLTSLIKKNSKVIYD
jgi:hypothetical protein